MPFVYRQDIRKFRLYASLDLQASFISFSKNLFHLL